MPELPEVETVRRQLSEKVIGKTIASVTVLHEKITRYDEGFAAAWRDQTIAAVNRYGKLLVFSFVDEDDLFLLAHLKMTGQFFYEDASEQVTGGGHSLGSPGSFILPNAHTRVIFHFRDDTTLYFNDMRLFGYTKRADAAALAVAQAAIGVEPIDAQFDPDAFAAQLRKRKTTVKAALLNQSLVAGLGNIYADEALWRARVRPTRRAHRLTKAEAESIAQAATDVLHEAIDTGGTTFQNFIDTGGQHGNFLDYLAVFARAGEACPRCGTTIKKIQSGGRGTHYCPSCQK